MRPPLSRRSLVAVAGTVVGGALVLGAVHFTGGHAAPAGGNAGRPEPRAGLVSAPPVSFAGVTWRDYHSVLLPYSADGPRESGDGPTFGFARTPSGALLAAVHIVVRAHALWGPRVFEPTIRNQVIGPDVVVLLEATQHAYESRRGDRPFGEALGRAYMVLEGYRWLGYTPRAATVDLVTAGPGDSDVTVRAVARVQVRWENGDWRVLAPPGGAWGGSAVSVPSAEEYVRFPHGGGR
ncbi:hypothetical protein [Actinomadura sp. WMMB 499]|uniref:hypothetical protein n=1 Tax=Actinomadura sp. WMMB 499 TaxID=1219491 RepID=UPI001244CD2B|nr:hypothetical protein [Actinomadura sp. WMMB 499]QFG22844.1 hypothetical protein F7P10_18715 [Actinomadura sp. WMMB 499]